MTDYSSGVILIEDSAKINVRSVLKYVLSKFTSSSYSMLCLEKTPDKWKYLDGNVSFIYYKNPNEWKSFSSTSFSREITTVIVDSVNQMSALIGWNQCLRVIDDLSKNKFVKNLILVLHTDCLLFGNKMTKQLNHISQTSVAISLSPSETHYLSVKSKLPGGKIKKFIEDIYYNAQENRWIYSKIQKDKLNAVETKTSLPEEVASFKISVEGSAKAVKDRMVLPYTELTRESKVVYHHDAADDWDEEDPDEDLDI